MRFRRPTWSNWTKHSRIISTNRSQMGGARCRRPSHREKRRENIFSSSARRHQERTKSGRHRCRGGGHQRPSDYLGKPLIDKFHNGAQPIDQFVLKDKDGQFYLYTAAGGTVPQVKKISPASSVADSTT